MRYRQQAGLSSLTACPRASPKGWSRNHVLTGHGVVCCELNAWQIIKNRIQKGRSAVFTFLHMPRCWGRRALQSLLHTAFSPAHELLVRQAVKGQPLLAGSNQAWSFYSWASPVAGHELPPSDWTGQLRSKDQKTSEDHHLELLELRSFVKLPSDKQHTDL